VVEIGEKGDAGGVDDTAGEGGVVVDDTAGEGGVVGARCTPRNPTAVLGTHKCIVQCTAVHCRTSALH
jgi:hypothetical protein